MERANRRAIYRMFLAYLQWGNFAAADMARKILLIGLTRARRYTNYWGGRKYDPADKNASRRARATRRRPNPRASFFEAWQKVEAKTTHARMMCEWKERYG